GGPRLPPRLGGGPGGLEPLPLRHFGAVPRWHGDLPVDGGEPQDGGGLRPVPTAGGELPLPPVGGTVLPGPGGTGYIHTPLGGGGDSLAAVDVLRQILAQLKTDGASGGGDTNVTLGPITIEEATDAEALIRDLTRLIRLRQ